MAGGSNLWPYLILLTMLSDQVMLNFPARPALHMGDASALCNTWNPFAGQRGTAALWGPCLFWACEASATIASVAGACSCYCSAIIMSPRILLLTLQQLALCPGRLPCKRILLLIRFHLPGLRPCSCIYWHPGISHSYPFSVTQSQVSLAYCHACSQVHVCVCACVSAGRGINEVAHLA